MAARSRFEWKGDELLERIERAARDTINERVDSARDDARATHPWQNDERERTLKSGRKVDTHLEHEIVSEHASAGDENPTGSFGYTRRKGFYGAFHETGTTHEHEFPTIRPAADRNFGYDEVIGGIRRRLSGGRGS